MALFAGPDGVMTGEELTYDYNFDPFSQKNVQVCRCRAPNCRGVLGPRPKDVKVPRSKSEKENLTRTLSKSLKRGLDSLLNTSKTDQSGKDGEAKREAHVLKKRKTARFSKGWVYVDPEMERMRVEEDQIEKGVPDSQPTVTVKEVKEELKTSARDSPFLIPDKTVTRTRSIRKSIASVVKSTKKLERTESIKKGKKDETSEQLLKADSLETSDGMVNDDKSTIKEETITVNSSTIVMGDEGNAPEKEEATLTGSTTSTASKEKKSKRVSEVLRQSTLKFASAISSSAD